MIPGSPFKFLDSYHKEDRDIFFGRDQEIEDVYNKVFQGKTLFIYGESGTGKSSLVYPSAYSAPEFPGPSPDVAFALSSFVLMNQPPTTLNLDRNVVEDTTTCQPDGKP